MFFLEADYELQVEIMAPVLPALDTSKFDVFSLKQMELQVEIMMAAAVLGMHASDFAWNSGFEENLCRPQMILYN